MSETESKQTIEESSVKINESNRESISKTSQNNDFAFMNSEKAHDTYAKLICREDGSHKKALSFYNQEFKDFSQLKPSKKGLTTFELEQKNKNCCKKYFGEQLDLVKKNMDGSVGEDLQKDKYKFGKKRFDSLRVMDDYTKSAKPEKTFRCENNKTQSNARTKKLNDYYKVNPIEILDKKTTKEMNDKNRKKVAERTKAFNDYMGSKKTEHLFKSYRPANTFVDKITNNPPNIIKKSIMENRKTQPTYPRYKFKHYIVKDISVKDKNKNIDFVKFVK